MFAGPRQQCGLGLSALKLVRSVKSEQAARAQSIETLMTARA